MAKIGLADYLSLNPASETKAVSICNSKFTVAEMKSFGSSDLLIKFYPRDRTLNQKITQARDY